MPTPLESRVARLERQNRTLRASLVLGAVVLVTCGGGGITSNFARVNTKTLFVVDGENRPTISLAAGRITFHGANERVSLDANTLARLLEARTAADE